jgi:hypothetical protein
VAHAKLREGKNEGHVTATAKQTQTGLDIVVIRHYAAVHVPWRSHRVLDLGENQVYNAQEIVYSYSSEFLTAPYPVQD